MTQSQLGRIVRIPGGMLAAVLLLIGTVQSVDSQSVCTAVQGDVQRHEYVADIIQTRMYYTVYTPPCYTEVTGEDYPVLYLMHGSNEDDNHWLRLGLAEALDAGIASGDLPPLVVVMPFGNWIANENRFDDASWYGVFINQLMPLVEQQYNIRANRATRAIGGISRGGFWAYHIGLRNPVLFGSVGGHSAFFDRFHAPPEYNPLDLAVSAPQVDALRLWLDRGADDYAAPGLDLMHERLTARGAEHTYMVQPQGQHNNDYWRQYVADYLTFYVEPWLTHAATTAETPDSASLAVVREEDTSNTLEEDTPNTLDEAGSGYLILPVVAFPSMEANISGAQLDAIRGGLLEPRLVLGESAAARLSVLDVSVAVGTRVVPDDALFNTLWRDTTLFTLLPFDQLQPRYRVLNVNEIHPVDALADYAFWFPGVAAADANFHPDRLTRMLMSGVTALTRQTIPALDANGVEWAVSGIRPYVDRADFFHTSNEVSLYPTCPDTTGPRLSGALSFCSKVEHFEIFRLLGLDIVELSGNHNNDYGYDPYRETLVWYRENGIATVGGGETLDEARSPLLINHNGNSVALLSCNWIGPYFALVNEDPALTGGVRPGATFCDRDWLEEVIPALQADHDLVVVTVQYLELDQYTPSDQQRLDFRNLADMGADVVLGTQAHFPQTFEFYTAEGGREAFLHYGLGNLFFDQQFFAGLRFFMDQLFIYEGRLLGVDLFTGIIEGQGRPRPMTVDERRNFLFLMLVQHGSY
ncbi:MAG: CapA family protein [Chloroflexota bacterium]